MKKTIDIDLHKRLLEAVKDKLGETHLELVAQKLVLIILSTAVGLEEINQLIAAARKNPGAIQQVEQQSAAFQAMIDTWHKNAGNTDEQQHLLKFLENWRPSGPVN